MNNYQVKEMVSKMNREELESLHNNLYIVKHRCEIVLNDVDIIKGDCYVLDSLITGGFKYETEINKIKNETQNKLNVIESNIRAIRLELRNRRGN